MAKKKLKSNQIIVAEGTDAERVVDLKILRGKEHFDTHLTILETFGQLQDVVDQFQNGTGEDEDTNIPVAEVVKAIKDIFGIEDFNDKIFPFALGLETEEEVEWSYTLLPLEKFTAYIEAASYVTAGIDTPKTQAAIKK